MSRNKLDMLKEETDGLTLAATHLQYSIARCADLIGQEHLPPEQLERLESLTSRFARVADLLTQRVFRLFDEFELTGPSTVLDRIYRAEKRGWLEASQMISIRELRNMIAHEYAAEKMTEIYAAVYALAQTLLIIVPNVTAAAQRLVART